MSNIESIKKIILDLRQQISSKAKLTKKNVDDAISQLSKINDGKYKYKYKLFPALKDNHNWGDASTDSPQTLAEALLWKMGSWEKYKNFSEYYLANASENKGTDVVNFAFAKHLRDNKLPIFDQHALRSLWAIDSELDSEMCKSILFTGDKWKPSASGTQYNNCYDSFVTRMNLITAGENGLINGYLDKLLMPLGKAIKDNTKSYADFQNLCGLNRIT